jgi:hypothetical protein
MGQFGGPFNSMRDLTDSDTFWTHTIVFGYQPGVSEDGDPGVEDPVLGLTREYTVLIQPRVSAVYVETIRDSIAEPDRLGGTSGWTVGLPARDEGYRREYWSWIFGTAAHEIGHYSGPNDEDRDHDEGGLMKKGGDSLGTTSENQFSPETIKRLRRVKSWSQGYP